MPCDRILKNRVGTRGIVFSHWRECDKNSLFPVIFIEKRCLLLVQAQFGSRLNHFLFLLFLNFTCFLSLSRNLALCCRKVPYCIDDFSSEGVGECYMSAILLVIFCSSFPLHNEILLFPFKFIIYI